MYRIGVDLGGTNIAVGVVDENLKIIGRGKVKTRCPRPAAEIFDDIALAVQMAVKDAGISMDDVVSVGVGTPGSVNKANGYIEFANNLDFNNVPAKEMLETRIGKTVYLDNDANCAALGEVMAGAAKDAKSALAVTLGTGVGGGIVINNRIHPGINGVAGEIGHMVIVSGGEPCTCGRLGCWEAYSSATALKRQTRRAMEANPDSLMWKYAETLDKVSGKTAFKAMRDGDESARQVVDTYIFYLAEGLTNVVNILQPDVVCIGGGVSYEGDALLVPLTRLIEKHRFARGNVPQPRIVLAKLFGDAGLIGAAMLGKCQ